MGVRVVGVSFGALVALGFGFAGCASDAGTGAAPQTTVQQLGPANYATLAPIYTSTIPAPTILGQVGTVAGEQIYTVQAGDYLIKITKLFCLGTTQKSFDDLALYNGWTDGATHNLNAGDTVRIPSGACAPGTQTTTVAGGQTVVATPSVTTTTIDTSGYPTYTVQAGDVLINIANKNGTTVDAIVAANGWKSSAHVINPGDKIKIPPKKTG